jgi:plastocyanin
MRFLPQTLEISAGDTVRWSNLSDGEPHTVTFLGPGTEPPENSIVEPQADGPPKLIQNPETLLAQGGDVYQGEGFFHSGFMGVIAPGGPTYGGSNPYELTFDTPGEYGYYCLLHGSGPAGPGMFGTIIVH